MLNKIKILNFKSIENMDLDFGEKNMIIGKNGVGKTNILQSICLLFGNNIGNQNIDSLIKNGQNIFYLEGSFLSENLIENKIIYSYDKILKKKNILLNGKKVTKKKLFDSVLKISYFSPITMNLFYLGPKYRRDFLDYTLKNTFNNYEDLLKKYEVILKNRNKILKNIFEQKSKKNEIYFWDTEFIKISKSIYEYRIDLNLFLLNKIKNLKIFFINKNYTVNYKYFTKVDLSNIEESVGDYLKNNLDRDIILGKTQIGPHLDDFDILIDDKSISNYASRGEMKSIILNLKLFEIEYIKEKTLKSPILLIDDFGSELDYEHKDMLFEKLNNFQIFFTSIIPLEKDNFNQILI